MTTPPYYASQAAICMQKAQEIMMVSDDARMKNARIFVFAPRVQRALQIMRRQQYRDAMFSKGEVWYGG